MNERQQTELRALREEQLALVNRLSALEERLGRFEDDAGPTAVAAELPPPMPTVLARAVELPVQPPLTVAVAMADADLDLSSPATASSPTEPLPAPSNLPPPIPEPVRTPPLTPPRESLEVRIGTTWLVRAGIVLALTSLAFIGTYLYQTVIPHLGPAAKIALLYVGAGALTGVGAFLERSRQARAQPRLRNYAQVLFAGGLSAIYYVTYAAHYFENLRVIPSALLAGALLLAWTAFMVFLAHRRNSETLATVAILLAYYTAAINDGVAGFTLFSNLALTGGAVFLLRRHLWKVFPFASLLATFGSYAFWTYYHSYLGWRGLDVPPVHASHGAGGFWVETAFLSVYWALFTWVVFSAEEGVLPRLRRAGFASLNNGAFFALVTWLVLGQGSGWFWKWSLGFGVVLLALAEACRRLSRPADPKTEDAYLLQGVLLVTTGFVAYFDGWHLSLILAIQTVTLLAASGRRSSRLLLACSLASAALAFGWAVRAFQAPAAAAVWLTPLGVGAVLIGAAYLAQRIRASQADDGKAFSFCRCLDPVPSYYSLLGCAVWLWLIGERPGGNSLHVLLYAGAAVVLTASVYALGIKALPVYAQGFLGAAFLGWTVSEVLGFSPTDAPDGRATLTLLAVALALGHWWQRLPGAAVWRTGKLSGLLNTGDAVLAVAVGFLWFQMEQWPGHEHDGVRVAEAAGLALAAFVYGVATRYRAFGVAGQVFLVAGVVFLLDLPSQAGMNSLREALLALTPLLAVLVMLAAAWRLVPPSRRDQRDVWIGTVLYEGLATLIFLIWTKDYLPEAALLPVCAVVGAAVFTLGVKVRVRRWLFLSVVPSGVGLLLFFVDESPADHASFFNLLAVAALAAQQQVGRRRLGERLPGWFPPGVQGVLMIAATLCAWIFLTARLTRWHGTSFTLAAGWSLFAAAVFVAGLLLHERIYRWLGLLVMAVTLGRIVLFDITQLDSLGKAISFFALAVVLLGVGFLYNKYQDKFRDLL